MRARLACVCVLLAAGCTRLNPAFDPGADSVAGTSDSGSDTEPATESGSASGEETGELCELEGGENLDIRMPPQCGEETYERSMRVIGYVDENAWDVQLCADIDCNPEGCPPPTVPTSLRVAPLPVQELAGVDACLRVVARQRSGDSTGSCEYQTAVVWEVDPLNFGHELVLLARSSLDVGLPTLPQGAPPLPDNFAVSPVYVGGCDCETHVDACCDGEISPALYSFQVGPEMITANVGDPAFAVDFGNQPMDFHPLNAFRPGSCESDSDVPDMSWAVTRK